METMSSWIARSKLMRFRAASLDDATVSPDGRWLATREDSMVIYVRAIRPEDKSDADERWFCHHTDKLVWSPCSRYLLCYGERSVLYEVRRRAVHKIRHPIWHGSWLRRTDGTVLLSSKKSTRNCELVLYTIDEETCKLKKYETFRFGKSLPETKTRLQCYQEWSPDGTMLAVDTVEGRVKKVICIRYPDNQVMWERAIPMDKEEDDGWTPVWLVWSADSSRLCVTRGGIPEATRVYVLDARSDGRITHGGIWPGAKPDQEFDVRKVCWLDSQTVAGSVGWMHKHKKISVLRLSPVDEATGKEGGFQVRWYSARGRMLAGPVDGLGCGVWVAKYEEASKSLPRHTISLFAKYSFY